MTEDARRRLRGEVFAWWRQLHPDDEGRRGDRAAAARLRRAENLLEVMVEAEAIRLYRTVCDALGRTALSESEAAGVGVVAGLLAGVRPSASPDRASFAEMLGRTAEGRRPGDGDRALFSPLRFAALVRAGDAEERLRHLRRAAALARGRPFDVGRLAEDMLWWSDRVRQRWIFDYHQRGRSAPAEPDAGNDTEHTEGTAR